MQPGQRTQPRLAAVLVSEQFVFGAAGVFAALIAVDIEHDFATADKVERRGEDAISHELDVGNRVEAIGPPGMAGDKD